MAEEKGSKMGNERRTLGRTSIFCVAISKSAFATFSSPCVESIFFVAASSSPCVEEIFSLAFSSSPFATFNFCVAASSSPCVEEIFSVAF